MEKKFPKKITEARDRRHEEPREPGEPPTSAGDDHYEMDPETRAVFEKIMKRRRKLFERLAKM